MASHDDGRREIVAAGDVSPFALRRKTVRVLDNLSKLLNEMELGWSDASAVKLQLCCRCAITHGLRLVTYSRLEDLLRSQHNSRTKIILPQVSKFAELESIRASGVRTSTTRKEL
jgi:hypothetical protein